MTQSLTAKGSRRFCWVGVCNFSSRVFKTERETWIIIKLVRLLTITLTSKLVLFNDIKKLLWVVWYKFYVNFCLALCFTESLYLAYTTFELSKTRKLTANSTSKSTNFCIFPAIFYFWILCPPKTHIFH